MTDDSRASILFPAIFYKIIKSLRAGHSLYRYRRIFPRRPVISVRYFAATLPGEEKWEPDRRRQGGKYLQRDGAVESADMNLLHPDEAKSNEGSAGKGKGDGRWRATQGGG